LTPGFYGAFMKAAIEKYGRAAAGGTSHGDEKSNRR
jgi:hypothetical protein